LLVDVGRQFEIAAQAYFQGETKANLEDFRLSEKLDADH
jgi:hypothetical protein